jgi:hypothetical protein
MELCLRHSVKRGCLMGLFLISLLHRSDHSNLENRIVPNTNIFYWLMKYYCRSIINVK